jgi:hypothetical protein
MKTSPQLQLFPDQHVVWETLPSSCQQSVRELLSLLLEQAQRQRLERNSGTNPTQEENHV